MAKREDPPHSNPKANAIMLLNNICPYFYNLHRKDSSFLSPCPRIILTNGDCTPGKFTFTLHAENQSTHKK